MMPYMRTPSSAMLSLLFQIMDDGRVCFRLSRVRYRVGDLGGGDFRVRYGSYDRTINMMGEVAKLAGYTDEGLGIEALYEDYPQLRNFDDAMDWTAGMN